MVLLAAVLLGTSASARAQVAEQGLLDSLVVGLERPAPWGAEPPLKECRSQRGDLRQVCEGLVLLRHAVAAPDSISFRVLSKVGLKTGLGARRMIHPYHNQLEKGYRDGLTAQRQLQGVRRTSTGVVAYALARWALVKGMSADSVDGLLAQARTAGGLAPGVLDLLEARLRFREGDSVGAWRAWERMLTDSTALTGEVAWALVRRVFPPELIEHWDGTASTAALGELSASPLHRSLVQVYLGQAPIWLPLEVHGRGYLLFRRGKPLLVGVFALPRQQLSWEAPGPDESILAQTVFPVGVELAQVEAAEGSTATDTMRYRVQSQWPIVEVPRPVLGSRPRWDGCGRFGAQAFCFEGLRASDTRAAGLVVEQGVNPESTVVTVALRQAGGSGAIQTFVVRPVPDADTLFASDLVLGMPGLGYTWRSFDHWVPIHPTGIYRAGAELSLFTQLRGLTPDTTYQVMLELLEDTDAATPEVLLTVRSTEVARADEAEWYKQVQLTDMKPGRYRVRVTFRQGGAEVVREDRMTIVR